MYSFIRHKMILLIINFDKYCRLRWVFIAGLLGFIAIFSGFAMATGLVGNKAGL
jgi:hypothetical protein